MLPKDAVSREILELLNSLMKDPKLESFVLVGGTALALQSGYRKSIDIDLFSKSPFDSEKIYEHLRKSDDFELVDKSKGTILCFIKNIKVDILQHLYPDLNSPVFQGSIKIASPLDIAAMKLNAIVGNGSRIKDFVDMAYLSGQMSLKEMVQGYEKKYSVDGLPAIRSLNYFKEINFKDPIELLDGKFNWDTVEKRLNQMLKNPDEIFPVLYPIEKNLSSNFSQDNDEDENESLKKVKKGPKL